MPAIGITVCALIVSASAAWKRFGPATYARFDTMFGPARVYEVLDDDGASVRLLEVGGIVQSGTYTDDERYADLVFEYLKRYDALFEGPRAVHRICVLGCGGYDYPEHVLAHHPDVSIDAVEIDPAITSIARRYFFLDRAIEEFDPDRRRLRLVCADARAFLEGAEGESANAAAGADVVEGGGANASPETDAGGGATFSPIGAYDAIVNDTFDAGTPPAHLTTSEFARLVHERLAPGGMYLTNIVSPLEGPGAAFLREQVEILEREFEHVRVVPCDPDSLTEPDNVIVIAR